jgi:hypothetical protein
MTLQHVMIDLETGGTDPGAPILAIGAVEFDPETGALGNQFYRAVDPVSALKHGRMSGDTFRWWLRQDDAAREAVVSGTKSLARPSPRQALLTKTQCNTESFLPVTEYPSMVSGSSLRQAIRIETPGRRISVVRTV